jgi:hypothetical protein
MSQSVCKRSTLASTLKMEQDICACPSLAERETRLIVSHLTVDHVGTSHLTILQK